MSALELMGELEAAAAALQSRPDIENAIMRAGVPRRCLFGNRPLVGIGHVSFESAGWFQFGGETVAWVVADGIPDGLGWRAVTELVAFDPQNPNRWAVRRGDHELLGSDLNAAALDYASTLGLPIALRVSPLAWLRSGCDGMVALDWGFDALDALSGLSVVCDSPQLLKKVRERIVANALDRVNLDLMREIPHVA